MRGWRRLPSLVDLIDVPLISRQLRCECVGDFLAERQEDERVKRLLSVWRRFFGAKILIIGTLLVSQVSESLLER